MKDLSNLPKGFSTPPVAFLSSGRDMFLYVIDYNYIEKINCCIVQENYILASLIDRVS